METFTYDGTYRGIVKDNDDPKRMRRIKVVVPQVTGDQITNWIFPMIGTQLPPNIGDGVYIQYIGGDPDYPVWIGSYKVRGEQQNSTTSLSSLYGYRARETPEFFATATYYRGFEEVIPTNTNPLLCESSNHEVDALTFVNNEVPYSQKNGIVLTDIPPNNSVPMSGYGLSTTWTRTDPIYFVAKNTGVYSFSYAIPLYHAITDYQVAHPDHTYSGTTSSGGDGHTHPFGFTVSHNQIPYEAPCCGPLWQDAVSVHLTGFSGISIGTGAMVSVPLGRWATASATEVFYLEAGQGVVLCAHTKTPNIQIGAGYQRTGQISIHQIG